MKYRVLRYSLKHRMGLQNTTDGAKQLEKELNALAEEGYEPKMFVESVDDLKLSYALIMEKNE